MSKYSGLSAPIGIVVPVAVGFAPHETLQSASEKILTRFLFLREPVIAVDCVEVVKVTVSS